MKRKRGEILLASIFLLIFVVLVIISLGYSKKTRRMPLVVGIPGVVLAAVEVLRGTILKRRISDLKEAGATEVQKDDTKVLNVTDEQKKMLKMIGWVVLLMGMIWILGFLITIPVYTLLFMKARKERWVLSIIISAMGFAMLYFLFVYGLNIELYPGMFFKRY